MTTEEFLAWAKGRGYRGRMGAAGLKLNTAYAYKGTDSKRICELNNRAPEIMLYFYAASGGVAPAIEADIYGLFNGLNRRIEVYGKTLEELVAQIEEIEAALVRMWEA